MMQSKQLYSSFSRSTTCIGVLRAAMEVNPTISEKNTVADSNTSGTTCSPSFNFSAQSLKNKTNHLNAILVKICIS